MLIMENYNDNHLSFMLMRENDNPEVGQGKVVIILLLTEHRRPAGTSMIGKTCVSLD